MAKKTLGLFFVFLTAILTLTAVIPFAGAIASLSYFNVDIGGESLYQTQPFSVSRGDTIAIHVMFTPVGDGEDVKVAAEINGYRKAIEAETSRFDVLNGVTYSKTLYLKIPSDIDADEQYLLNVDVKSGNFSGGGSFTLQIQRNSYSLDILSIEMPSIVAAGRTLTANIVVKNRGSHKAEDVYIKASVPKLGLEKLVYAKDLVSADTDYRDDAIEKTLSLTIPATAKGSYNLVVEAYNDDATVTKTKSFSVGGIGETTATTVLLTEASKEVGQGKTVSFEMTLVNLAETSQSYSIDVLGTEGWAVAQVIPSTALTLGKEESKKIVIDLTVASSATLGQHNLVVSIKSGNEILKQENLVVGVVKSKALGALIISAIVLAVILVVLIVALILIKGQGASKAAGEEVSYY